MSSPVSHRIASAACALSIGAAVLVGCGPSGPDPNRPVSTYQGRAADLFDDSIDPAAVGLDFDKGYAPKLDKALRDRAQTGDAVVRARVSTVTAKTDGPDAVYQIGLHTVEKIAGQNPPPVDFTIQIDKNSEAYGIAKNFESRLVGYGFVAFVREFAHPSGERELHFHLAPDTKEVKGAVTDALILGELKPQP